MAPCSRQEWLGAARAQSGKARGHWIRVDSLWNRFRGMLGKSARHAATYSATKQGVLCDCGHTHASVQSSAASLGQAAPHRQPAAAVCKLCLGLHHQAAAVSASARPCAAISHSRASCPSMGSSCSKGNTSGHALCVQLHCRASAHQHQIFTGLHCLLKELSGLGDTSRAVSDNAKVDIQGWLHLAPSDACCLFPHS